MAHYDRNSGSHISGMVAQACRTGGSLEHRLFKFLGKEKTNYQKIVESSDIQLLPQETMNPGFWNGYGGILYYLIRKKNS